MLYVICALSYGDVSDDFRDFKFGIQVGLGYIKSYQIKKSPKRGVVIVT